MIIDSLFVALGFEIEDKALDDFKAKTESTRQTMLSMATAVTAAAGAIGLFVGKMASNIDELGDFAEQEQVAIDAVQELGYAAQLNGSSLDAMKSSIQGINQILGDAALGVGRGAKMFEKLGFEAKDAEGNIKSFDDFLLEVSDRIQGLSRQEAISMTSKLGIDRSLIPMLMKGRDAIEAYREEARALGITSEEDAAKAGEFNDALDRTKFALGAVAKSIAVGLMPQLTAIIEGVRAWILENREVIRSTITRFIEVLTVVINMAWQAVSRLLEVGGRFLAWLTESRVGVMLLFGALGLFVKAKVYLAFQALASAVRLVASALTVANTAALITSALIGGLIIGIGLLVDDYLAWKEGSDSVIGDLVAKYPQAAAIIKGIEDAVVSVIGWFKGLWEQIRAPLGDLMTQLGKLADIFMTYLWPAIKMSLQGWLMLFQLLLPVVVSVVAKIVETFVWLVSKIIGLGATVIEGWTLIFTGLELLGKGIYNFFMGAIDAIKAKFSAVVDWVVSKAKSIGQFFGISGTVTAQSESGKQGARGQTFAPTGALGKAGDISNSQTSNTNVNTNVNAPITVVSPDPAKAGESVRKELQRMNKQATRNATGGVAY